VINRDWQDATVSTLSGDVDEYGQPTTSAVTRQIKIYKKIYTQTNVNDPRYAEVDEIALTTDKNVTTSDTISTDTDTYRILYIIPSTRYTSLLLRRKS